MSYQYQNIILNGKTCTVFLTEQGMRIGFGGIGKDYAAERAKILIKENVALSDVMNASGDLTAWGLQPNGKSGLLGC